MSKIYIVTSGIYSDYAIDKVCTTKTLAQQYIQHRQYTDKYYDTPNIEEWDVCDKVVPCKEEHYYVKQYMSSDRNNRLQPNDYSDVTTEKPEMLEKIVHIKKSWTSGYYFAVEVSKPKQSESPDDFRKRAEKVFYDKWYQYLITHQYVEHFLATEPESTD